MKSIYRIGLDIFSGRQNPSFEITKEDFDALLEEIALLPKGEPALYFEGLGFRGITGSEAGSTFFQVQNNVVRLDTTQGTRYLKSNPGIISKAAELFRKYDKERDYTALLQRVTEE